MERQLGARGINIDSLEGWVRFYLPEPTQIDVDKLGDAMAGASYELHGIEIGIKGKAVEDSGSLWFAVDGTGQRFPLQSRPDETADGKLYFVVEDWEESSPKLKPTSKPADVS